MNYLKTVSQAYKQTQVWFASNHPSLLCHSKTISDTTYPILPTPAIYCSLLSILCQIFGL